MTNILTEVLELMQSDDCNQEKQSAILEAFYVLSNTEEKAAIDYAFTTLCGYSLKTIMEGVQA